MSYASAPDFVEALGELEARTLAPTTPPSSGYDQARILAALEDASATLDTYFAARFATPLDPAPRIVRVGAIALAREQLDRTGRDVVKAAADRARSWARDVSKGVATLGGPDQAGDEPPPVADGGPVVAAAPETFSPSTMGGFLAGLR